MVRFDPLSGQVYRETVVKPRQWKPWEHQCGRREPARIRRDGGAASLTTMVLRQLVYHTGQLSPEILERLPAGIAQQISSAVRDAGRMSFHTWKRFVESGREDRHFRYENCIATSTLNKPLMDYYADITSNRCIWLVDLHLFDLDFSATELRQLATISNLATLQVTWSKRFRPSRHASQFDDDVLGKLSSRAAIDGSLSRLQMLILRGCPYVTGKSFAHLSRFARLDTFCILETGIARSDTAVAAKSGWSAGKNTRFNSYVQQMGGVYMLCERDVVDFRILIHDYIEDRCSKALDEESNVPRAEIIFGDPNRASDDYDKMSQIICFERDIKPNSYVQNMSNPIPTLLAQDGEPDDRPAKKRKLKSGKAVALDAMLDRF